MTERKKKREADKQTDNEADKRREPKLDKRSGKIGNVNQECDKLLSALKT
jgi:hypothetical protein